MDDTIEDDDLRQYAALIGFDLDAYPFLRAVLNDGLRGGSDLPPDWEAVFSEDDPDVPMYWNRSTDAVTVTHPVDDIVREKCRLAVEEFEQAKTNGDTRPLQRRVTDDFPAVDECVSSKQISFPEVPTFAPQAPSPPRLVGNTHFYDLSPREIARRVQARLDALALTEMAPTTVPPAEASLPLQVESVDVPHPLVNEAIDKASKFEEEVVRLRRQLEHLESQGHQRAQQHEAEKKKLAEALKLQAARAAVKVLHERLKPPNEFYCPILNEVMKDPVVTVDGFTYEREAITTWFKTSNRSPCTNLALPSRDLIPNLALRQQIEHHFATMRF